jgi:UDP-GlcNAc:undecaprenyl-phosphate GlcNAc-1-phosphate transferase
MWVLHLTVPGAAALRAAPSHVLGVVLGGAAMCAVGVIVDTGAVRAVHRLALQTGAATFAYACGFRILAVHVPFVGDLDTSAGALPFTVLWIVGVINIVGLMDGLEGLAVGVTFFAAATNLTVALLSEAPLPALLSGALTGAALGALIHTQRSARVQVRDAHRAGGTLGATGSYFAGYVLATTALCALQKTSTAVSLVVPILALGVPIFDTLFAMVRCVLERRSLFSPDREHIHHRLVDMGITRGRAVLIIYAFCAVFTVVAIGASMERTWHVGAALFAASVALVGLARFVGYFDHIIRAPSRVRALPLEAELLRRAFPRLPRRLADATSEAQLFEALERFAQEAGLCFTEVLETRSGSGARCLRSWSQAEDAPNKRERGGATTYPLGGGGSRAAVQFGLRCEEVPPQAEILLQIAADLLTQHLLRLRSALTLVDEPTTEHEAPAVLDIPARPSRV